MKIVIVESPTKAKTISKFLTSEYKVLSSFGHIRDLPKSKLGVEIENNFKPKYIIPKKAKRVISSLKKAIQKGNTVILATDEDREGESIAWHLKEVLGIGNPNSLPYQRIVFHEITKSAIEEALRNPRDIDLNLVEAQQARRILDRLVGYELSPFLWKKIAHKLSAGRVQSVAVRLVVEREKEIESFVPKEYWTIEAKFLKTEDKDEKKEFGATLVKKDGKVIPKLGISSKKEAEKIIKDLEKAEYKIIDIEKRENKKNPLPPFTTSTLQQEAWKRLKFPAKYTMWIAQQLYERGFISYHRSDSLHLSEESLFQAKNFILENYGKNYWAGFFRKYKTKGIAQEAHEAIRPTFAKNSPQKISKELDKNQLRLYELIWRRFLASQMAPAIFYSTQVEIESVLSSDKPKYIFKTTGQILKFEGFLKIYPLKYEERELPDLEVNDSLKVLKLIPLQHFTQPPPRYNEASLIKELEKHGIGRPSTYAPILSIIQERNYVRKDEEKRFRPTEIGRVVNDLLVKHFPEIVDIKFTANMEGDLDKIARGEKSRIKVLSDFYFPFKENLEKKYKEVIKEEIAIQKTEKICPKCKGKLVIRLGKFGRFLSCSNFPKCDFTAPLENHKLGVKCPQCGGEIVEKRTKKGKTFYACSNWPNCNFALWEKPINKRCPKCNSLLVKTKKNKIRCSNKNCHFEADTLEP